MIKTKPILFSGPMVRAILDGKKTQTRRIIKPQPEINNGVFEWIPKKKRLYAYQCVNCEPDLSFYSPYGEAGNLLWVKETYYLPAFYDDYKPSELRKCLPSRLYSASDDTDICGNGRVRQSIFMIREFSRITLEIKDIRVERLQDISEEDAKAEGVFTDDERPEEHDYKNNSILCTKCAGTGLHNDVGPNLGVIFDVDCTQCDTNKKKFKNLWGAINGFENWDTNPWLWVVDFTHHICNVDEYMKKAA